MHNDAGEFVEWLNSFDAAMRGQEPAKVPCGKCVARCTSSKFILVRPSDTQARKVIPKPLLFAAPNLPKGYHLMGYNQLGHCPMFKGGQCSIYEQRPETCRQYDCRVLAATGASTADESADIAEKAVSWKFSYKHKASEEKSEFVRRAMLFLREHSNFFPKSYLPQSEPQKSALATRIHKEFIRDINNNDPVANQKLIEKITKKYPTSS